MLTNNQRKLILQLSKKKYRIANNLFVAEGKKVVNELIASNWRFQNLFSTEDNFHQDSKLLKLEEMKKITHFKTPSQVLGVFFLPESQKILSESTTIALDGVSDPGNLGTIIRLCDWFGLSELICSKTTVDCYNPKVVQSAMGSLSRVNITYLDLENFLNSESLNRFGTFINGESVYENKISTDNGIVVFGNEANGISSNLRSLIDVELTIPRFNNKSYPESLNLSNSLGIILSEFSRKSNEKKN